MGKKKPKYAAYVVKRGREPGIVRSWEECEKRVAGFSNAEFKGYETMYLAEQVWNEHLANTPQSSASSLELQQATDFHSLKGAGTKRARPYVDLTLDDSPVKPAKMLRRDTSDGDGFDTAIPLSLAPKQEVRYPKLPHEFTYPTTPFTSKLEVNYPTLPTTSGPTESPYFQSITAYVPEDIYAALKDTEEDNLRSKDEDDFERDKTIVLTQEQQAVVDMAVKGHNIFLTGAAGCGKTATLRKILGQFREKRRSYQVVAPTGIAALALNGKTAHSFMGWSPDSLCKPLTGLLLARQHAKKVASIEKIDVLIIEEISMVENQFLERMNYVLQAMMDTPEPMGGKQVILLGDFYQLPPVKPFQYCMNCGANMKERLKEDNVTCYNCENPKCKGPAKRLFSKGDQWAFKSKAWQDLNLQHVKLDRIHRQKSGHFQGILNKVRDGIMLTEEEWKQMEATKDLPRGICPVKLMSRKADVENCNLKALEAIRFSPVSWKAVDTCWRARSEYENVTGDLFAEEDNQPWKREDAFQGHRFSKSLTLKVGAKVVLLNNLDMEAGLVNGSQGVIVSFKPVDPEDKPEEGGRHRPPWERDCLSAWRKENPQEPVVRFANGLKRIIPACASVSRKGTWQNPYMACRIQIPLTLGWALTIHKSQGMTLEFVEVSKRNIFEAGQLYVALSRATSLEGLVLTGYDRKQLAGDNDVINFYNTTDWNAHLRTTKASHRRRK